MHKFYLNLYQSILFVSADIYFCPELIVSYDFDHWHESREDDLHKHVPVWIENERILERLMLIEHQLKLAYFSRNFWNLKNFRILLLLSPHKTRTTA